MKRFGEWAKDVELSLATESGVEADPVMRMKSRLVELPALGD